MPNFYHNAHANFYPAAPVDSVGEDLAAVDGEERPVAALDLHDVPRVRGPGLEGVVEAPT